MGNRSSSTLMQISLSVLPLKNADGALVELRALPAQMGASDVVLKIWRFLNSCRITVKK